MVLLASALVLTLGLSASRITTTETKIDTDQELLKRAFNTAESGIDYYLATGDTSYSSTGSDGAAELQVTKLGEVKTLSFNTMSLVGSYEYFWLVNHDTSATGIGTEYYSTNTSTINICSINPNVSSSAMGSLKIDYFYLSGATYKVNRTVLPTGSDGCVSNFDISNAGTYKSLLLVVTPVDVSGRIEIRGAQNFPVQGEQISSTGRIEGVNNTVTVLNRYDVFLTEGIVSGGDVTSQ
jgi:Tfp pilus assembly protein PilX